MSRSTVLVFALALAAVGCERPRRPDARDERAWELTELFDHETGWTGGDVASSVALSTSRTLWLFGDTILDRWSEHPHMMRNSAAVQTGREIEFFWGAENTELFAPRSEGTWLWPGDAIVHRGELLIFLHEFAKTSDGAFGFTRTGEWLARVADFSGDPSRWKLAWEKLPWFGESTYFGIAAVAGREGALYVYGAVEELPQRFLVLARVVSGRWQYLDEDGWADKPGKLKRLEDHMGSELTVKETRSGFELVTTRDGLSTEIDAWIAPPPEGPWSGPLVLAECPDSAWDPSYFCYAAKAHPELARAGERVVVSYVCNTSEFAKLFQDRRIYRPRFVVLR